MGVDRFGLLAGRCRFRAPQPAVTKTPNPHAVPLSQKTRRSTVVDIKDSHQARSRSRSQLKDKKKHRRRHQRQSSSSRSRSRESHSQRGTYHREALQLRYTESRQPDDRLEYSPMRQTQASSSKDAKGKGTTFSLGASIARSQQMNDGLIVLLPNKGFCSWSCFSLTKTSMIKMMKSRINSLLSARAHCCSLTTLWRRKLRLRT
jgi:hypothetical protein